MKKREILDISKRPSYNMWIVLLFLCAFGLLMVFSATAYEASLSKVCEYDSLYYVKRQASFMIAGFVFAFLAQYFNYHLLYKFKFPFIIYLFGLGCILLLKTGMGVTVNGATRWLSIGGQRFQVAELVKITVIIFLAYMVRRYQTKFPPNRKNRSLYTKEQLVYLAMIWLSGLIPAAMIFKISKDLSSALVIVGITVGIAFICIKDLRVQLGVIAAAFIGVAVYLVSFANHLPSAEELETASFRVGRIAAWLAPEAYATDQGYQVLQSLYAIGRGKFFGVGIGSSLQKFKMPEAQNDMIFAIICEELGVFGAIVLIFLFVYLLYQIMRVAMKGDGLFGSVLATGVFLHIAIQVAINIAVSCNMFPNTGLPLPFISYGGTAVFLQLLEMALVFSVERRSFGKEFARDVRMRG